MRFLPIVILLLVIGVGLFAIVWSQQKPLQNTNTFSQITQPQSPPSEEQSESAPKTHIIAQGLEVPWAIAFLPDGGMLVTERPGRVRLIDKNGSLQQAPVAEIPEVREIGEGGLMGITLHPNFSSNNYVYLMYTYRASGNNTFNRVVRMTYKNNTLSDQLIIQDEIPGASNHNGGRIKFGPDRYLYITTGDAENPSQAQSTNSFAGKILRVTESGQPAPGNMFGTKIYSLGHRNPQGIAWDTSDNLWETEHGPSGLQSGNDEVNRIDLGKNYGWPTIQGNQTQAGMETPVRNSGTTSTWAPAGAAFVGDSLFFGGLRGQTLYEAVVQNNTITIFNEHFNGEFGRIREVIVGPDNMLYITTSNRDGRGSVKQGDDKIIRINPSLL